MTTNRSAEELGMRERVIEWGRSCWREARVVEELVVMDRRIDVAFVSPRHLVGVEIKSSKDTLDRLGPQLECFRTYLPEVWVALAPRWVHDFDTGRLDHRSYLCGRLIVTPKRCATELRGDDGRYLAFSSLAHVNEMLTAPMLQLLWHAELTSLAARTNVYAGRKRMTITSLIKLLSRKLTGDEIVEGVCRELRGRDARWKADPPCAS